MSTDPLFDSWHSYPSIYALGHRALADLFLDPVIVEEKIDGSQFSFGRFNGELKCRSKGCVLNVIAPEKMFQRAVDVAGALDLVDGWTYRAEYLLKPKHNALAYDRIPASNLIVFDVNTGHESYMAYADKEKEALRLGLDVVPLIYEGRIDDVVTFRDLIDRQSCLGGQKVEGVVVKNYARFGLDKKVLLGKFVSEAFKEVHGSSWREANPTKSDIVDQLIQRYKTPARWAKAVQHLSEAGKLDQSPRDIGLLMKEVWPDIEKECADDIRDYLYAHFADKIRRGVTAGLPEWYKQKLLESQFNKEVA
jgi:hypothetical protein